ncbi:hypothetical protein WOLCODRAFT_135427 [Wolfiporia cocos MD-104 SS10]|uniref:Uncharacterized protein n=1 Tax=Wolfiporia cocos (strain MD-104) TaxID=742152 RepID=A0A2H3J5E9_WOLCO|nr:hypothetical protein WOLCODRAFT_135427 [Wolfiporia cocos MD-104 SS10]
MTCTKGKHSRLSDDSSMRPHAGSNEPLPAETRNVTSRSEAPERGKHYRFVNCSVPNLHTRKRQLATADDAPAHKRPRVEDPSNRAAADPVATSAATIEENLTKEGWFSAFEEASIIGPDPSLPVEIQIGIRESDPSALAIAQWAEIGFRLDAQALSDCVSSSNPVSLDAPPVDVVNTLNIDSIASPGPTIDSSALSTPSLMALTIASTPQQHSASLFSSPRASSFLSPEPDIPALCRSPESVSSYDSYSILSSPRTRISEVRPHQPTAKNSDVMLPEQWDLTRDVLYARYRERGLVDLSPASEDTFSYTVPPASLMSGISSIMQEHR